MPLPWLIGAAVVAAAAAVVKAVSDDDSSSSNSGEEERLEQEREAKRQHELERLETQLVNLKKNRLERAHGLLVNSAAALGKPLEITVQFESEHSHFSGIGAVGAAIGTTGRQLEAKNKLTFKKLDSALMSKEIATSEYAQAMDSALRAGESSQSAYSSEVSTKFLTNLRVIDNLRLDESPVLASADASPLVFQRSVLGFPSAPAEQSPQIVLSSIEREDFEKIYAASARLEHLHHLKSQLELQE